MKLIVETQTHFSRSVYSKLEKRKKPIVKYFKDSIEIPKKEFESLLVGEFTRTYERTLGGDKIIFENNS